MVQDHLASGASLSTFCIFPSSMRWNRGTKTDVRVYPANLEQDQDSEKQ